MSGKAILIVVLGIMSISFVSYETIMTHSNESSKTISDYYYEQQAYNISQSGINMTLKKLEGDANWRTGYYYKDMFGGLVNVTLIDTLFEDINVIKVSSTGIMGYNTNDEFRVNSIAYIKSDGGYLPWTIKAAVTSNSNIKTNGNLIVDGRDHDLSGKVNSANGIYAIWTTGAYTRSGNSTLGSTVSEVDYAPAKVDDSNVCLQGQVWTDPNQIVIDGKDEDDEDKKEKDDDDEDDEDDEGKSKDKKGKDKDDDEDEDQDDDDSKITATYPATPEEALGGSEYGFTPGILKEIAKSGKDGSQYVDDPKDLEDREFSGITYVELGDGNKWNSVDISGSGILIVHNEKGNALLKNLNSGTFKGIIIVDDITNIHSDIIGAVFTLANSSSEKIGNGNGKVLYSKEAISNAVTKYASKSNTDSSGKKSVMAWWN